MRRLARYVTTSRLAPGLAALFAAELSAVCAAFELEMASVLREADLPSGHAARGLREFSRLSLETILPQRVPVVNRKPTTMKE